MTDNKLVNISIIFIATVVFVIMLRELQSFIRPLVIAIILTFLLMPVVHWSRKHKIPYGLSIAGVILGCFVILIIAGIIVAGEGVRFATGLSTANIETGSNQVEDLTAEFSIGGKNLSNVIDSNFITGSIGNIAKALARGASQLFGELFVVLLFLLFILPSHEIFIKNMKDSLGPKKGKEFVKDLHKVESGIRGYLVTKSFISVLTAIATGVIAFFFGLDLLVAIMIITFILNFIPSIGSTIAVGAALLIYLLQFGIGWPLLIFGIILLVVQNFFGNYLEPKITGNKLNMSPVIILLSLFFWSWVWGIPGMLLSVPLTASIKIALESVIGKKSIASFFA